MCFREKESMSVHRDSPRFLEKPGIHRSSWQAGRESREKCVAAGISGRSLHWTGQVTGSGDGEKVEVRITPRQRSV